MTQGTEGRVIAGISLSAGSARAFSRGRWDWETLGWAAVFILSIFGYWKGRHEDPWNPPGRESEPQPVSEFKMESKN